MEILGHQECSQRVLEAVQAGSAVLWIRSTVADAIEDYQLFNQADLVELRTQKGIHRMTPGLTGWAQINGRDELPIPVKVEFDEYYVRNRSLWLDIKIIIRTLLKVIASEGIAH